MFQYISFSLVQNVIFLPSNSSFVGQVKKEYLDLHKRYAPLWAKEEQERCKLWKAYFSSLQSNHAPEAADESNG